MNNANNNIILDIQNLTCGYGGKPILEGFNLVVGRGEVLAITGPNGCGKSTILKAIYQLCKIEAGTILYKDQNITGKTPELVKSMGVAYFMQKNAIFPHLSVKDNLYLALNGLPIHDKKQRLDEILVTFPPISEWLKKNAGLLSGGQRQQLSLGMLLAQDADLWLLDEPTAGLDDERTELFIATIKNYIQNNKISIVLVEHKSKVVNTLSTTIKVIKTE